MELKPIGISPATLHSLANVAHDAKERPGIMSKYRKSRAFSPEGFFECEGRGLQWLGEASSKGGPRVVDVYDWGKDYLDIERVNACGPTLQAAHDFGASRFLWIPANGMTWPHIWPKAGSDRWYGLV